MNFSKRNIKIGFIFNLLLFYFTLNTLECKSKRYHSQKKELELSLNGGTSNNHGFLNILIDNEWHSLCEKYWDLHNSKVLCRELGFSKVLNTSYDSNDIDPSLTKSYDYYQGQIKCDGNEHRIENCPLKDIDSLKFNRNCNDEDKVYITCSPEKDDDVITNSNENVVKMNYHVNDQFTTLQIQHNKNEWKDICFDNWTLANSFVSCLQLGYPSVKDFTAVNYIVPDHIYSDKKFKCTGNELTLDECNTVIEKSICRTGSVHINCNVLDDKYLIREKINDLRLRGGFDEHEGRVEVFRNGEWGTICDDKWDIQDANVVCRQLGFGSAKEASHWADHGEGLGKIHFVDVSCLGLELNLNECKKQVHENQCTHTEDAGVRCRSHRITESKKLRLVNDRNSNDKNMYEGRIEVLHNGNWAGICGIGFSNREGQVVCKQLGLGFAVKGFKSYKYGINYEKVIFDVKCHGNETDISKCQYKTYGRCRYYDMASVICSRYAPDLVMDISRFQKSIKIQTHPLRHLRCSYEENCLAPEAYKHYVYSYHIRILLKFTSMIINKGAVSFRPHINKDDWEWHSCHQHYHSMETFAQYDLIDNNGVRIADGHKASFCLEDSECENGYKKDYNCTDKGDQGISVNCGDNYKNTLDCQWIDITEVPNGNYSLRVHVNPQRDVAESDWLNNRAVCELEYFDKTVKVKRCTTDPCYKESFGGNAFGHCCHFPFVYKNETYYDCFTEDMDRDWCSTTYNYDEDKKWGFCSEKIEKP